MKKILLLLLMFVFSMDVSAQEMTKGQMLRKRLVEEQDNLLDFLLQTPFEMRQYIFPMLNEKRSVPKKIKTHPEIIIWKGKRPTRIAKKFQNDEELLTYLPAQFYYYLAPEMWPDEFLNNQPNEANPNQVFLNFMKTPVSDNFAATDLIRFKNGLNLLKGNLTDHQKKLLAQKDSPVYLKDIFVFPNATLNEQLKSEGLDSTRTFVQKVDKVAALYRQYQKGKLPQTSGPEETFVKEYFSLIPILFQNTPFQILLDKKLYSD